MDKILRSPIRWFGTIVFISVASYWSGYWFTSGKMDAEKDGKEGE